MNVLEARVVLRDRTLLDVVDLALRFVAKHARPYAKMSVIVIVPAFVATLAIAHVGGWGWAWTVSLAMSGVVASPFTALASRLLFEPSARLRDALGAAGGALGRLLTLRLLEGIALTIGGVLFLLPAVWLLTFFLFANEVVVLERAGIGAALARLQRLLSGQTGDAIMSLLFLTALWIVAIFLGDALGRSVLEDVLEITPPPSLTETKGSALGLAAFWAFMPFGATCRFLLYINLRTRSEGWDVQTRFAAIAARAEEEVA